MPYNLAVSLTIILISKLCLGSYVSDIPNFPSNINVTNILHQYVEMCGPIHLCNMSTDFMSTVGDVGSAPSFCSPCSCDNDCYNRGDCCPDKFPLQCHNSVLYNSTDVIESYFMVDVCPENSNVSFKARCEEKITKTNFLSKYPVTEKSKNITYKNVDCARCNAVTDVDPWSIDITCPEQRHFTQYSSPEEVWDAVEYYHCTMKYVHVASSHLNLCRNKLGDLVNKCNVTGQWLSFDKDIDWACTNYDLKYEIYQNVFCYLCNTGEVLGKRDRIAKCNVTGHWNYYSPDIVNSCNDLPYENAFLPYKNRYCYMCNSNRHENRQGVLTDANIHLFEFYQTAHSYSVTNINIYSITEKIEDMEYNKSVPKIIPKETFHSNINLNITALRSQYVTAGGTDNWCYKQFRFQKLVKETNQLCSCHRRCYSTGNCCPDIAFYGLGSIVNGHLSGLEDRNSDHHYIMISSCPSSFQNKSLMERCEMPSLTNIMTFLPVFDLKENSTYRNTFCRICSIGEKEFLSELNESGNFTTPWNLQIKCLQFISFRYFPSLKMIIKFAKEAGCTILTLPKNDSTKRNVSMVTTCNVTGSWQSRDTEVETACQRSIIAPTIVSNIPIFQNVFCEICNLNKLGKSIPVCNTSGSMTNLIAKFIDKDKGYSENQSYYLFKNKLCKQSNWDMRPRTNEVFSTVMSMPMAQSYKRLFSISTFINDDRPSIVETELLLQGNCDNNFIYDPYKKTCRKIYCARGKYVSKGSCLALFRKVNEIKYQIALRLETENLNEQQKFKYLYSMDYQKEIISLVERKLRLKPNSVLLDWYFALFNAPCQLYGMDSHEPYYITSNDQKQNSSVKILRVLINFSINVNSEVPLDRLEIENRLINFTQNEINLKLEDEIVKFIPYFDEKAFYLPSTIYTAESQKYCKIIFRAFTYLNEHQLLRPLFVSKLLLCRQIELEEDEFSFISIGSIHLKTLNRVLNYGEFQLYPSGRIRICLDDYVPITMSEEDSTIDIALSIFTLVCTCCSLICLILTFIAHISFPILQSLPGKNIMCLVVALFLAQLSFLIGIFGDGDMFCQIIGALTHYFWLSCFFCMNVCSFHMYRVFTSSTPMESNRRHDRKILIRYCIYSFGTPLIIVMINISVSLIVYNGSRTVYGGIECFHGELLSVIFSFMVPIAVIFICNMIFFICTICKIKFTANDTSTKNPQLNISIYVKLFTLTGVSWILQIVDSFFETSLFSFIVTLLNGCQGVYIFISYVCTRRVLKLLRERHKQKYSNGTSESPTKSRVLQSQTITDSPKLTKCTTIESKA